MQTTLALPQAPLVGAYLPRANVSLRVLVWSCLTGVALVLPAIYLLTLVPVIPADVAAAASRASQPFLNPWGLLLKAVIIYPIVEEIFYRGLLREVFRRRGSPRLAVVLPTMLFAMMHVGTSLNNVLFALLAGCFFAWLATRSDSLFPSIVAHSAINLAVLFVLGPILAARGVASREALVQTLPLVLLAGSLAVFIAGLTILKSEFRRWKITASVAV